MLSFGLCRHGEFSCPGEHPGCDLEPTVETFSWNEDGGDAVVSAKCGIAAILADISNINPVHIAPERYNAGRVNMSWSRSWFGFFPTRGHHPDMPLFFNGFGQVLRYDRRKGLPYEPFARHQLLALAEGRNIIRAAALENCVAVLAIKRDAKSEIQYYSDIHEIRGHKPTSLLINHEVSAISISHNCRYVAYGTREGELYVNKRYTSDPGRFSLAGRKLTGPVTSISWSSCDSLLGYCGVSDERVCFVDIFQPSLSVPELNEPGAVALDIGPLGDKVAIRLGMGAAAIWAKRTSWIREKVISTPKPRSIKSLGTIKLSPAGDKAMFYNDDLRSVSIVNI